MLRKDEERNLQTLEMGCVRRTIGMTRRDRIRNENIISRVKIDDTVINTVQNAVVQTCQEWKQTDYQQSTPLPYRLDYKSRWLTKEMDGQRNRGRYKNVEEAA